MTDTPQHSELGASIAHRWANCGASVRLSRGRPNTSSAAAQRGIAGHAVAFLCLTQGQDPVEYVDRQVEGVTVDSTLAEDLGPYVAECLRIMALPGIAWQAEVRFSLESLNPPAPMFGTADFTAYDPATATLYVRDLKTGYGEVEADSPQLLYYALGAAVAESRPVSVIDAAIVQPKSRRQVKRRVYDAGEAAEWSVDLLERARAALEPDSPAVAGTWCKYCPAAGVCPAQAKDALQTAQSEFSAPPEIRLLSPAQVSATLHKADQVEQFIDDLRAYVRAELQRDPESIPGWKLIPGQGHRKWLGDDATAESVLAIDLELAEAEMYQPRKVVTPAAAEKAITARIHAAKGGTKKAAAEAAKALIRPYVTTASESVALVPAADPRPALPAAGSEFPLLPAPQSVNP